MQYVCSAVQYGSPQCMVEPGAVKPLGNFTAQESLVDSLLQQFTQVSGGPVQCSAVQ